MLQRAYATTEPSYRPDEPRILFGDRETRAALRISDLLGTVRADPGFGGVDLPPLGRTVSLTLVQSL